MNLRNARGLFVSKRTRHHIIEKYKAGCDKYALALHHDLNTKRFEETESHLSEYEQRKDKSKKQNGSKMLDDDDMKEMAFNKCIQDPTTPLQEYREDIYAEFGVYVCTATVHNFFKENKWNWKRISLLFIITNIIYCIKYTKTH